MHNLSVVLLSTCNGGSSLQEYEKENLKPAIRNLKAVSSKGGKATLKGDDCLRNSNQMSCLRDNFSVAIPELSVSKNTDSEFNTYFSQALPKLPEDKTLDGSEVSQVSIYKKLWIEAEASVCKLKYELQVACMKLATKKGHDNTETVPMNPSESDKTSTLCVSGGKQHSLAKESSTCAATLQCHRGDSDGSQSPVVNRVSTRQSSCILASSPVSPPPAAVPQQCPVANGTPSGLHYDHCHNLGLTPQQCYRKCDLGHNNVSDSYQSDPCQSSSTEQKLLTRYRHHNAVARGPGARSSGPAPPPPASDILSPRSIIATKKSIVNGVDAEMLARLEVLESHIDKVRSLGENKCEERQEASKESHAVEDGVLAELRILKSCTDNITSLSLESSKHQLDTNKTDEVDDAVDEMLARLKVLESRIDTLSSLGENNYEEQQRESAGSYAVDDAVLARILKSRAENITSLGLESSKQQRDASTNTSGEIDDAGAEMCTRLEALEPCIETLSSLGDNKYEKQQKEDGVLARLQILKSRADNIISLGLESSKQQLNASTDVADEVDDAVMARLRILKSRPDLEASSIGGNVEGVEDDTCAMGLQVSSHQPPPSPAAVSKKTTLPSATEPLEVTGETPAILILPSIEVPPLSTLEDAPSVLERDHSGLVDDALPPAPLPSVPQEVRGLGRKPAKVKCLPRGSRPRTFRLPCTVKIKRPISEQGARAILLRKLGVIKDEEVDEQAINRCLEILEASFPKSLLQAIFCGSDMMKGTPGELWGISASDVVF